MKWNSNGGTVMVKSQDGTVKWNSKGGTVKVEQRSGTVMLEQSRWNSEVKQ